jgi:hypothetical protein
VACQVVEFQEQRARILKAAGLRALACAPCESSASAAGARAECKVGEDDDDDHKSKPPHSHHAGVRNGSRSLRLDPSDGGNGGYDHSEAEPYEPVHDSPSYKMRASRARRVIRGSFADRVTAARTALAADVARCIAASRVRYHSLVAEHAAEARVRQADRKNPQMSGT